MRVGIESVTGVTARSAATRAGAGPGDRDGARAHDPCRRFRLFGADLDSREEIQQFPKMLGELILPSKPHPPSIEPDVEKHPNGRVKRP